jgi:hypothetical protein
VEASAGAALASSGYYSGNVNRNGVELLRRWDDFDKLREGRCPLYDDKVTNNRYASNTPVTIRRQVLGYGKQVFDLAKA